MKENYEKGGGEKMAAISHIGSTVSADLTQRVENLEDQLDRLRRLVALLAATALEALAD